MSVCPTPRQLNVRHREFWKEECANTERRAANPQVLELAMRDLHAQAAVRPVHDQLALEQFLQDNEIRVDIVLKRFAQRGGQSKKPDGLQKLIVELVQNDPLITAPKLLERLRALQAPGGVIEDIDDGEIAFKSHSGLLKSVPISGLKDRLSRAKKALNSR